MAWLAMYLLEEDVEILNGWLNQEEEIAFLVTNGLKRWIAKKEHGILADIRAQTFGKPGAGGVPNYALYSLWHVPSGPLPLLEANRGRGEAEPGGRYRSEDGEVEDPWQGWTEIRTGLDPRTPYFGAGHPGIIDLKVKLPDREEIMMSGFGWIGNHYRIIGNGADPVTERFWNKLRKMVKKVAVQIPRQNNPSWKKEVYAFPSAYQDIQNGRPCALNPWL